MNLQQLNYILKVLKTEFKPKKYLPFVSNWEGSSEYPRKDPVDIHIVCVNFDTTYRKCLIRDIIIFDPNEVACCNFKNRFGQPD